MQLFFTGGSPFLLSILRGLPTNAFISHPRNMHRCGRCGTATGIKLEEMLLFLTKTQDQVIGAEMNGVVIVLEQKVGEKTRGVYEPF